MLGARWGGNCQTWEDGVEELKEGKKRATKSNHPFKIQHTIFVIFTLFFFSVQFKYTLQAKIE